MRSILNEPTSLPEMMISSSFQRRVKEERENTISYIPTQYYSKGAVVITRAPKVPGKAEEEKIGHFLLNHKTSSSSLPKKGAQKREKFPVGRTASIIIHVSLPPKYNTFFLTGADSDRTSLTTDLLSGPWRRCCCCRCRCLEGHRATCGERLLRLVTLRLLPPPLLPARLMWRWREPDSSSEVLLLLLPPLLPRRLSLSPCLCLCFLAEAEEALVEALVEALPER